MVFVFCQNWEPQYPEFVVCRNEVELDSFVKRVKEEWEAENAENLSQYPDDQPTWQSQLSLEETKKILIDCGESYRLGWFSCEVVLQS